MGMSVRVISHSTTVLKKLANCMKQAGAHLEKEAVEWVQQQMLYGYSTPHGKDGHTEIYDTGYMAEESISAEAHQDAQNTFTVSVGSSAPYAHYVHNGTYKLEARPFLDDALMAHKEDQKSIYLSYLKAMDN